MEHFRITAEVGVSESVAQKESARASVGDGRTTFASVASYGEWFGDDGRTV